MNEWKTISLRESVVDTIKSIPRVLTALTVQSSSYIPFLASLYPIAEHASRDFYTLYEPSMLDYGIDVGIIALGLSVSMKLQKPINNLVLKIIYDTEEFWRVKDESK